MVHVKNVVVDPLSRLENGDVTWKEKIIMEEFLDGYLMEINKRPWFSDMINYKAIKSDPEDYT